MRRSCLIRIVLFFVIGGLIVSFLQPFVYAAGTVLYVDYSSFYSFFTCLICLPIVVFFFIIVILMMISAAKKRKNIPYGFSQQPSVVRTMSSPRPAVKVLPPREQVDHTGLIGGFIVLICCAVGGYFGMVTQHLEYVVYGFFAGVILFFTYYRMKERDHE